MTRTHPSVGDKKGEGGECGGIRDPTRLDRHASRSRHDRPPDAVRQDVRSLRGTKRHKRYMVVGKLRRARVLAVRPTLEEDMRRLTLVAQRASKRQIQAGRWKSLAVMGCTLQQENKAPNSRRRYCN